MNSAAQRRVAAGPAFTYFDNKSNTLSGQIPAGVTITLQTSEAYNTSVIIADGTTSAGTIVLASTRGDRSSQIVSQGTFTNLAGGAIQTNGGNGGTRYLDGHIVSQGTISIGSGINVITEQGGQVDQQGGTVNVPGYWELDKSTYNFSAGGTSGAPTLVNSALNVSAPAGAGAFTYFDNKSNTLSGQIPAGVTITLQTSEAYNTSVMSPTAP